MLVQADEDVIHLLPALPQAWPRGSIRGLRVMGGALVDLTWDAGQLRSAIIRGGAPGERTVRLGAGQAAIQVGPRRFTHLDRKDFKVRG
jgi:alpha-L-fucosidase 2